MTYRSSGVVNFAHAAIGTYLAFAFFEFRETGDLVLPLFAVPHRVHLLPRPTVVTALAFFILYGALIGLVIQQLVFKRLRRAPALARVVASVGLFLYFWSVIGLDWPLTPNVRPLLPKDNVTVLGRLVGVDRLLLGAIVAVLAALLWLVSRHTRFGLATTAASENQKGAVLAGLNPDRLAAVNWMIATSLAGLAMIFSAQIVALDALNNSLLIVPALAAALLGNFKSFPVVAAAGFGIGMLQSELLNLQTDITWLPQIGLQQGVPFLIILVAMAVRGDSLPTRGQLREGRYPAAPEPRRVVPVTLVLTALAVAIMLGAGSDWRAAVITSSIFALFALSMVVLTGFVGQISLASYAFAGFAAFTMVKLSDAGLPFPLSPLLAAALTCLLGILVGLPAVKVRGLNLAIVTLGAAVAIQELLFKWDWFVGSIAATEVPEPSIGGLDLTIRASGDDYPRAAFGLLCIVVLALAAVAVANLRRGTTGLQWLAVRANEQAAAAAGINVAAAKLSVVRHLGLPGRPGRHAAGLPAADPVGGQLRGVQLAQPAGPHLPGRDRRAVRRDHGRRAGPGGRAGRRHGPGRRQAVAVPVRRLRAAAGGDGGGLPRRLHRRRPLAVAPVDAVPGNVSGRRPGGWRCAGCRGRPAGRTMTPGRRWDRSSASRPPRRPPRRSRGWPAA